MNSNYDPINNVTKVELDEKWTIAELTPVAELYDAHIQFAEILERDVPIHTVAYLVMHGDVRVAEVLMTIAESVNDAESVYG